ncbi:MAG: hypothetical protein ACKOGA_11520, partial [Planctomycetaceae bacterium]
MPRFALSRRPLAATCIRRWRSRLTASLAAACLALAPLGPLVAADTPAATQSPAHVTAPAPTREQ